MMTMLEAHPRRLGDGWLESAQLFVPHLLLEFAGKPSNVLAEQPAAALELELAQASAQASGQFRQEQVFVLALALGLELELPAHALQAGASQT